MSEPAHTDMTTEERLCARCQHAVPRYLGGGRSRNAALRERLGMDRRNAVRISGVIRQALRNGLLRPADSTRPARSGYVPFRA